MPATRRSSLASNVAVTTRQATVSQSFRAKKTSTPTSKGKVATPKSAKTRKQTPLKRPSPNKGTLLDFYPVYYQIQFNQGS